MNRHGEDQLQIPDKHHLLGFTASSAGGRGIEGSFRGQCVWDVDGGGDGVPSSPQISSSSGEGSAGGLGECGRLNYSFPIVNVLPAGGF